MTTILLGNQGIPKFIAPLLRNAFFFRHILVQASAHDEQFPGMSHYPGLQYEDTSSRWAMSVQQLSAQLDHRYPWTPSLPDLSSETCRRALVRRIHDQYQDTFHFADASRWVFQDNCRFILSAPRPVRDLFETNGYRLRHRLSAFLWGVESLWISALAKLVIFYSLAKGVAGFLITVRRFAIHHPVLWLGLTAKELTNRTDGLNALRYARSSGSKAFTDSSTILVQAPWLKRPVVDATHDAVLGADLVSIAPSTESGWSSLIHAIRTTVGLLWQLTVCQFGSRRTWLLLSPQWGGLVRYGHWLKSTRPMAIVLTNSMYLDHPLWVSVAVSLKIPVHLLFYSTNCQAIVTRDYPPTVTPQPSYNWLDVSTFHVWNDGQSRWLQAVGVNSTRIQVTGPIVWGSMDTLLNPQLTTQHTRPQLVISLFDVIPANRAFWSPRGRGEIYYDAPTMTAFLQDIVMAVQQAGLATRCRLLLKSKRVRMPLHDADYHRAIEALAREGQLELVDSDRNALDLVRESDLVISAPFSSPSLLASSLGIPTCYYDPTGDVVSHVTPVSPDIPLLHKAEALSRWLSEKASLRCAS